MQLAEESAYLLPILASKTQDCFNSLSIREHITNLESGTVIANSSSVPAIVTLNTPTVWLALIGLVLTIVLLVLKVKGAILISIVASALFGIQMGLTSFGSSTGFTQALSQLPTTFGAAFGSEGMGSLFSDMTKLPLVLMTIFAFSLSDTFCRDEN